MSGVATAIGGSAVLGLMGSSNAANAQTNAANQANALSQAQLDYQKQIQSPYQEAGTQALTQMQDPRFQKSFSMSDFTNSPGYQYSLQQGQNALNAANAASGNAVSGAGMAALSGYNVGQANNEYQQAFNNYNTQLGQQYGRLSTLAAGGAGANSAMGAASQSFANQAGSNMLGIGNAQAGAGMANANIGGQALSQLAGAMNAPTTQVAGNAYGAPSMNGMQLAGGMDSGDLGSGMSLGNMALG